MNPGAADTDQEIWDRLKPDEKQQLLNVVAPYRTVADLSILSHFALKTAGLTTWTDHGPRRSTFDVDATPLGRRVADCGGPS